MIDRKHEVLCWNCHKRVSYKIKARQEERTIKGIAYPYNEKYALCDACGEEIFVPGLDDENECEIDNIYRKTNDLITIDEINMIMKKYNIEKRPLSNLMGFGEITITRYLDGQLPTKKYSDMLKRLLRYDEEMKKLLENGKENITDNAYRKVKETIEEREYLWSYTSKIEIIAIYIIESLYEVTNLSLQKLLYYVKALGYVFYNKDFFEEECEAWVHGPVFAKIYEKYKSYGRTPIKNEFKKLNYTELLTNEERELCNYVLENLGIYNGSILREFTHRETPWLVAREGLGDNERCTNIIQDALIKDYFKEMNEKYHLETKEGLSNYIKSLNVI